MIRRVRTGGTTPTDGQPYVLDTFDIDTTIARMISTCPPGLVAVSLRAGGSRTMIPAAERAARRRGARVLWVKMPASHYA